MRFFYWGSAGDMGGMIMGRSVTALVLYSSDGLKSHPGSVFVSTKPVGLKIGSFKLELGS